MLSSVCVSHNQFQLGIEWTRKLMRGQTGVTVTLPMNALNGYWDDPRDEFTAVITKPRHDGHYVAEAMCDDGVPIDLTSSILLMSGVKADWRAPSARMLMHRAESFDLPAHPKQHGPAPKSSPASTSRGADRRRRTCSLPSTATAKTAKGSGRC